MKNELIDRLSKCTARASDAELSRIWKAFEGTEFHQALDIYLDGIERAADKTLFAVDTPADIRAFAAGQKQAIITLRKTVAASISFDPATATYQDDAESEDTPSPDSDQEWEYTARDPKRAI